MSQANFEEFLAVLAQPRRHSGSQVRTFLATLKDDEWEPLVQAAISALSAYKNEPAMSLLNQADAEHPEILQRYLKELFLAEHYFCQFYNYKPWRDGGIEQISFLESFLENPDLRERALGALLELRLPEALALIPPETDPLFFHNIGFSREPNEFRQLYPREIYHLQFAHAYAANWLGDDWVPDETWMEVKERPYQFGGLVEGQCCATCGDILDHLLTFPASEYLPSSCSLPSLTLATCNGCLGWEPRVIFLHHDVAGVPQSEAPLEPATPEFNDVPFEKTTVALTPVSERYRWQEWTHQENIHRLGGHPTWIQEPEYPDCPGCQRTMTFLLQLNSRLPFVWPNPEEVEVMEWGSGGIAYFFWCDACRVSAGTWQCT